MASQSHTLNTGYDADEESRTQRSSDSQPQLERGFHPVETLLRGGQIIRAHNRARTLQPHVLEARQGTLSLPNDLTLSGLADQAAAKGYIQPGSVFSHATSESPKMGGLTHRGYEGQLCL